MINGSKDYDVTLTILSDLKKQLGEKEQENAKLKTENDSKVQNYKWLL